MLQCKQLARTVACWFLRSNILRHSQDRSPPECGAAAMLPADSAQHPGLGRSTILIPQAGDCDGHIKVHGGTGTGLPLPLQARRFPDVMPAITGPPDANN
jgi:hypothetical protein